MLQALAGSAELGKQLAEVVSLLQQQDLLESQISSQGEALAAISRGRHRDAPQVQTRIKALNAQYSSLEALSKNRWARVLLQSWAGVCVLLCSVLCSAVPCSVFCCALFCVQIGRASCREGVSSPV